MNFTLISRYLKIFFSYYIGRPLSGPDSISVIISGRCNLKCQMCDFWKDNKSDLVLPLETYRNFFHDAARCGVKSIQFTGGEPLLNNEIYNLIACAKNYGLSTVMFTNGTLITDKNAALITKNLDTIYISIDAPNKQQQDKIRGVDGAFEKSINGIRLLVEARKENHRKMRIIICSIIVPDGIHDPLDMLKLARDLGIDRVIYNPASSLNYGNTQMRDKFSEDTNSLDRYDSMVDKIIKLMEKPSCLIRSNPFYLEYSKEFLRRKKRNVSIPCYGGGYNGPTLSLNGEIFPCCAWNKSMGNIADKSFFKIWWSAESNKIRKKIKTKQCPTCHHQTRTFDYIIQSPFLIKDPIKLIKGYGKLGAF